MQPDITQILGQINSLMDQRKKIVYETISELDKDISNLTKELPKTTKLVRLKHIGKSSRSQHPNSEIMIGVTENGTILEFESLSYLHVSLEESLKYSIGIVSKIPKISMFYNYTDIKIYLFAYEGRKKRKLYLVSINKTLSKEEAVEYLI